MPTEQPKPNFFLAGVQKAGTSALAVWLQQHPEIAMSFPKEPGFLAFGTRGYAFADGYGRPAPAADYVVTSERDYMALFAAARPEQRILGEASTWYFALPGMAARIKAFNPAAKALVVLRNPVERAYSAFSHARRDQLEPCDDFGEALRLEEARGEVEFLLRYHAMGCYADALEEYMSVFGPDELLVLLYEDLGNDPAVLWRKLCRFLSVDDSVPAPPMRRANPSGVPRLAWLQRGLRSHGLKRAVLKVAPHAWAARVKERADRLNLRPMPGIQRDVARYLRDYYADDIARVARLTGRGLDDWLRVP